MKNLEQTTKDKGASTGKTTEAKPVIQTITENPVVRIVGYGCLTLGGILAVGFTFRVVAWTMTGYNQMSNALANKKP